VTGRRILL